MAFTTANIPDRAHSELKFHKYYGDDLSMHETASPEMIAEFQKKYPRDFYCFGIPREFPVARFDLPAGVMLLGAVGELEKLRLTGVAADGIFLRQSGFFWIPFCSRYPKYFTNIHSFRSLGECQKSCVFGSPRFPG